MKTEASHYVRYIDFFQVALKNLFFENEAIGVAIDLEIK